MHFLKLSLFNVCDISAYKMMSYMKDFSETNCALFKTTAFHSYGPHRRRFNREVHQALLHFVFDCLPFNAIELNICPRLKFNRKHMKSDIKR